MSITASEKISVLIVEDERIIAMDMSENLTDLGYKIVGVAATGSEAIDLALHFKPDVILMDINLPGEIDGIEAAEEINKIMDAAIIYLTAYADDTTLERAKFTSPYGYLIKPFEERELQTTIEMTYNKHKLEIKVKENERWLLTTLKSIGESVIATDDTGKIIFLNTAAEKLLSLNNESVVNKNAHDVIYIRSGNDNVNLTQSLLLNSPFNQHNQKSGDFFIVTACGDEIPVLLDVSPIIDDRKNISGLVVVIRDITEKKNAEKKILSSERRLSALIDSAMDAVITIDSNFNIVIFNTAAEKIFLYKAAELIGEKLSRLIPERFKNGHDEQIIKFKNGAQNIRGPLTNLYALRKTGEEFPIEASIAHFSVDQEVYYSVILRDVTEKKLAEQRIRMLSSAVEQSSANIMVTDTEGKIVYVNPKFEKISGYSLSEVIGKRPDLLETDKNDTRFTQELWNTINSGLEWHGEYKNKRKDGSIYWEETTISPVKDSFGRITNFLSVNEDITKRKLQEEQLILAKENAEKANNLKSEFIAQISHEIRTPLNSILSFAGLIREEVEDKIPPELASSFKIIDTSANRLIRTIELLLNLFKLQTGNFEVKLEMIDLNKDILDDIVLEFYSKARTKGLDITYSDESENASIIGDRYILGQIFSNLIENAVKYTNSGEVKVLLQNINSQTAVSVIDTGIGISKEYISNLFTPFSQEEFGYTRRYEGTGLGLALVKRYVEILDAQIDVESEKDKGSKFRVIFNTANNFKV